MRIILVIFLLVSLHSSGQWKSFTISIRGDTLNRVDMNGKKQGPWVIHQDAVRGEMGYDEQGYFLDNEKDGKWVRFSLAGDKLSEENFRWGALDGRARYYTRTGGLMREESWRAVDPSKTMDTVDVYDIDDPTKVIDQVVVKLEGQTMKHGVWKYYDPRSGDVEETENYFMGKLRTGNDVTASDEELKPIDIANTTAPKTDSTGKKTVTKPQAVLDYEKKNSGKKKIKTRDGSTGY